MLQIIIWLGCFYLALKGVEIYLSSLPAERDGDRQSYSVAVLLVALIGAIAFLVLANKQADSSGTGDQSSVFGSRTSYSEAQFEAAEAEAEAALEGSK